MYAASVPSVSAKQTIDSASIQRAVSEQLAKATAGGKAAPKACLISDPTCEACQ
jgi:polysaccharide deacetylase 2 family uncharacterized protein YibQ